MAGNDEVSAWSGIERLRKAPSSRQGSNDPVFMHHIIHVYRIHGGKSPLTINLGYSGGCKEKGTPHKASST